MKHPRFLVVDDHPLTRAGTIGVLRGSFPGATFEEAGSLSEARRRVEEVAWDLVFLDQNLPDGQGVEIIPEIFRKAPVLMVTMYMGHELCTLARNGGARGFLSKCDPPEAMVRAAVAILDGGTHFPPHESASDSKALSERESSVLQQILRGRRLADVARDLSLSPTTVQSYRNRLLKKFHAGSVAELIRLASERGLC